MFMHANTKELSNAPNNIDNVTDDINNDDKLKLQIASYGKR
jgi:hypothetical protein